MIFRNIPKEGPLVGNFRTVKEGGIETEYAWKQIYYSPTYIKADLKAGAIQVRKTYTAQALGELLGLSIVGGYASFITVEDITPEQEALLNKHANWKKEVARKRRDKAKRDKIQRAADRKKKEAETLKKMSIEDAFTTLAAHGFNTVNVVKG